MSNLKVHEKAHLRTNTFKCPECNKEFKNKRYIESHIRRTHGDGRVITYPCVLCEYKANKKCNLTVHINSIHGEDKTLGCDLCSFISKNKDSFKNHMNTHKNNNTKVKNTDQTSKEKQ